MVYLFEGSICLPNFHQRIRWQDDSVTDVCEVALTVNGEILETAEIDSNKWKADETIWEKIKNC